MGYYENREMRVETSMDVPTASAFAWQSGFREPGAGSRSACCPNHIFVIVNVPFPVQPLLPVSVQVPVIVLPLAVPDSASVLPEGFPDRTDIPNFPFTLPLKFPLSVKEPLSVSPERKHGEFVVNWKFDTLSEPSLLTCKDVPKEKTVVLPPLANVAFHVPLMLEAFELLEPQPISAMHMNITNTTANRFMRDSPGF